MLTVNKYKQVLLDEFYLDSCGVIRRTKEGYLGRFAKDDVVSAFKNNNGYWHIQVPKARTTVKRSHLALLLNGVDIPDDKEVDHRDGNKDNDHPDNLRVVNRTKNSKNRAKRSDNTSGVTGIRWSEYHQHFVIRKTVGGKRISTSRKTMEEAIVVIADLQKQDGDYTQRHGI